jgi:RNase P/RNase MRP subunit POP5
MRDAVRATVVEYDRVTGRGIVRTPSGRRDFTSHVYWGTNLRHPSEGDTVLVVYMDGSDDIKAILEDGPRPEVP